MKTKMTLLILSSLIGLACEKTREINNTIEKPVNTNTQRANLPPGEGGMDGSGGKGLLCIDENGKETVEVLDLWESTVLQKRPPAPFPAGTNLRQAVDTLFDRMKHAIPPNRWGQSSEGFVASMKESAARFFPEEQSGDNSVVRMRGVDLQLTQDSYEFAKPKNCQVVQIINYQKHTWKYYLDQDLFDKLSFESQAAMIAHEMLYDSLRGKSDDNSLRTRRLVGYVASGLSFPEPLPVNQPKKILECTEGDNAWGSRHQIDLWDQVDANGQVTGMVIYPRSIDGQQPMGLEKLTNVMPINSGEGSATEMIVNEKCGMRYSGFGFSYFYSPIEFDRSMHMSFICKNNKLSVSMQFRNPGPGFTSEDIPLKCKQITYQ